MHEVILVSVWRPKKPTLAFKRFVAEWEARGYQIEDGPSTGGTSRTARIPLKDKRWRDDIARAISAGAIEDDWSARWIEQVYSAEEVANAPLFSVIHTGRCIDFPTGRDKRSWVCHITSVDERQACPRCGAGARQEGPLRIPAAELNKAGNLASIWIGANTFWMISDSLRAKLEKACRERLPVRTVVPIGSARLKEKWWQLVPEWAAPVDAVRTVRFRRLRCSACGAIRLTHSTEAFGAYYALRPGKLNPSDLPPLVLDPFWEGDLEHTPDGRVIEFPQRRLWIRGDVGRALAKLGNRRLDLHPIIAPAQRDGSGR